MCADPPQACGPQEPNGSPLDFAAGVANSLDHQFKSLVVIGAVTDPAIAPLVPLAGRLPANIGLGGTMRQFFRRFDVGDGDQFEVVVDE
jgi:hypothetical protein